MNVLIRFTTIVVLISMGLNTPTTLAQKTESSLLKQAQSALEQSRYTDAEMLLQRAIEQDPNSAEVHYTLGLSLHQQSQLEEAISAYQNAIQLDPTYDVPKINLGLALIELNDLEKASTVFREVLALSEREETPASIHTLAHYNLAIIFNRQENNEAALGEVQAALMLTPDFAPAQKLLIQLQ